MTFLCSLLAAMFCQVMMVPQDNEAYLRITTVEPAVVEAYTPLELAIEGAGFDESTRVFIQTVSGSFLPHNPEFISSTELILKLPAGFGMRPAKRILYVSGSSGEASNRLHIDIVAKGTIEGDGPEILENEENETRVGGDDSADPPRLDSLQPAWVLMAQPVELLLVGENFAPESTVELLANINAGTSRPPEYLPVEFEVEFLDESLLLLYLDRGFAPYPAQRSVRVINPDGSRSNEIKLKIATGKER